MKNTIFFITATSCFGVFTTVSLRCSQIIDEEKNQEKEKNVPLIKPALPTEELPEPSKPDTINFSVDEAKEKKKKKEED